MKALILAGGFATRLDPLAYFVPKPLLPIGGKPIIDYVLDDAVRSGADEVIVSTNITFSDQFEYWKARATPKVPLTLVVERLKDGKKIGAIRGIDNAIESLKIYTDLLVLAGDNFYNFSMKEMVETFNKYGQNQPVVGCFDVGERELAKRFGVVELNDENKIMSFEERPKEPKSSLVSTALYLFPRTELSRIKEYVSGPNNPDAPGHFIKWLYNKIIVRGHRYTGKWYDIGTLSSYKNVFDEYAHFEQGQEPDKSVFFEWFNRVAG